MIWQEVILIASFILAAADIVFLVGIYFDDHAVRLMTEESLGIQRESLAAQKQYLDLRRKWYEARSKKKDEKTTVAVDGVSTNS